MATKQQLIARWETQEGQQKVESLYQYFKVPAKLSVTLEQLHTLVDSLPYTDEVAPNLDWRGLHLGKDIYIRDLDLPRVRLDYSALRGNLHDGNWSGAVFDGADVTSLSFGLDLTRASFIKVNARKVRFTQSTLTGANFSEAKLIGAYLNKVPCNGANFSNADMRDSSCLGTDLRGANLTGTNLVRASLGHVLFDASTKIEGANFTGTSLSENFKAFVVERGGQPNPYEKPPDYDLAVFDATIALVQEGNKNGFLDQLLAVLTTIRQQLHDNPQYDWEPFVEASLPAHLQDLFYEVYEEGMGQAEYYM